ncbi:MerR family transcriptional regulator [Nocardioides anomalus]|uniref:MerR family transcriptional regulator n=1 Tax=Nocardioides anomalus TaxID=2712223 RepID=A0A6G6W9H8_9ACTN|nr:DICT sensory domain-containing protein [Nocardioides anomalus]QIG41876.1 MerR family transcriptional regulator [Nocardioides anomalus]
MSAGPDELIGIGELEARTGVASTTLRAWERRVGFPAPVRTAGGQRRYLASDVERVGRVLAERQRGLSLSAAVAAVNRVVGAGDTQSLYAALRAAHPHLEPIRVGERVMKALSWSIEDECLAYASRPLLFGCFQHQRHLERAGRRWRELARSATSAVTFSDFAASDPDASPARVALPEDSPMRNEWAVVCVDPRFSVVLVAWEPPRDGTTGGARRFEGLVSLEPEVVRDAAAHCATTAAGLGLPDLPATTAAHTAALAEDPGRSISLLRRFATYADA